MNKRNLPVFFPQIYRALSIAKSGNKKNVKVMSILLFLETYLWGCIFKG